MGPELVFVLIAVVTAGGVTAAYFFQKVANEEYARKMASAAADLGFSYYRKADVTFMAGLADAHILKKSGLSGCQFLMTGKFRGMEAALFEYEYFTYNGSSPQTYRGTVACLYTRQRRFPAFLLRPEGFGDSVANFFGQKDIDFDSYPEFSRRYFLKSETEGEGEVRDEFRPNVIQFFESEPGLSCEAKGDRFLLYRENVQVPPERLRQFLELAMTALRQFRPE